MAIYIARHRGCHAVRFQVVTRENEVYTAKGNPRSPTHAVGGPFRPAGKSDLMASFYLARAL